MESLPNDKYIIFLDVDGTVFDGTDVAQKTREGIDRARTNGHKVFINSGRAHCVIPSYILNKVSHDGIVGGMGTAITVGNKLIYSARMEKDTVEFLLRFGQTHGYFTIAESIDKLVIMNGRQVLDQKTFVNTTDEFFEKYSDMTVTKITYWNTVLPKEEIDYLKKRVGNVYVLPDYVEIPAKDCNKATAIKRVCEHYGAEIRQTIAMGDSENDFDMIKFAGVGVAMGNADEKIKSIADFITTDCSEGGVADALDALIFKKNA